MKQSRGKKIMTAVLMLALVLTLVPMAAGATGIQAGAGTITPNIDRDDGTIVGFAGQEWWVIGYDGTGVYTSAGDTDSVTLLVKGGNPYGGCNFRSGGEETDPGGWQSYDRFGDGTEVWWYEPRFDAWPNEYKDSTLQRKMQGIYDSFGTGEQRIINARATLDDVEGTSPSDQKLWPLSIDEYATLMDVDTTSVCNYGAGWWLRSSSSFDPSEFVGAFDSQGAYHSTAIFQPDDRIAARPALSLDLSSVLFSSAASGAKAKPAAAGEKLTAAATPTGAIKFTMEDTRLTLATATVRSQNGADVVLDYTGATAGKALSAVITDNADHVLYYGKLAAGIGAADSASVTLPTGYDASAMKLKVFAEETNGDNHADFASTPLTVAGLVSAPTVTGISGVPATGAVGTPLTLSGTVAPANAAHTAIEWSLGTGSTAPGAAVSNGEASATGVGTVKVRATIKDGRAVGADYTQEFEIAFSEAPVITTASLPEGVKGAVYDQTMRATGTSPITWSLDIGSSLPAGLNLSSGGVISGTPAATGTFDFTVKAQNTAGSATKALRITVGAAPPVNHDPINRPDPNKAIDTTKDFTQAFGGDYANMTAIRLNGRLLTQTAIDGRSAHLSGYPERTGKHGKVESGSVIVTLYKEFLKTLPNGIYTLEVTFMDGSVESAGSVEFKIEQQVQPTPSPSPSASVSPSPSATSKLDNVPKTGDGADIMPFIVLVVCAMGAAGAGVIILRRKRQQ